MEEDEDARGVGGGEDSPWDGRGSEENNILRVDEVEGWRWRWRRSSGSRKIFLEFRSQGGGKGGGDGGREGAGVNYAHSGILFGDPRTTLGSVLRR